MDPEIKRLEVQDPAWGFSMNAYIVRDPETDASAIVDPGAEAQRIVAAAGEHVASIWITHGDFDHVGALEAVHAATGAPIISHPLDVTPIPGAVHVFVGQGDTFTLGKQQVRVLHIPGHTPGHIAFVVGRTVLGGDLLFPGGPGHTGSPEAFKQLVDGIVTHLFALDQRTVVYPGHGDPTTIGAARREYAAFTQRRGTEGLYGDVTWAGTGQDG